MWSEYEAENVVIVRLNGRLNEKLKCEAGMLCQIVNVSLNKYSEVELKT